MSHAGANASGWGERVVGVMLCSSGIWGLRAALADRAETHSHGEAAAHLLVFGLGTIAAMATFSCHWLARKSAGCPKRQSAKRAHVFVLDARHCRRKSVVLPGHLSDPFLGRNAPARSSIYLATNISFPWTCSPDCCTACSSDRPRGRQPARMSRHLRSTIPARRISVEFDGITSPPRGKRPAKQPPCAPVFSRQQKYDGRRIGVRANVLGSVEARQMLSSHEL